MNADLSRWVGVAYGFGGTIDSSLDCWQLVRLFAKEELGRDYPQYMYDTENDKNLLAARVYIANETGLNGAWQAVETPEAGDVLIFRLKGIPIHCGIFVGNGDFLHTLKGRYSCLERLTNWQAQHDGTYRHTASH